MMASFRHIWPYLVVTIPIAVAVNMSGASRYIKRAFDAGPLAAILLATVVGAFSPFCSCGVIPVIAVLLIGGVPLPPVMAFWIASPSMDPEIFFLSVGTIGWNLAVWRLAGTLFMSLGAGFITHYLMQSGWITGIMGKESSWAIFTAALLGIPVYTSNLSALPMVGGLMAQGMGTGAALAFLIAGPATTLSAMAAVWTLVKHRIFILYLSFALGGALLLGYLHHIWG